MKTKSMLTAAAAVMAATVAFGGAAQAEWNEGGGEQDKALHLEGDVEHGREVYEVCSACHMPEGWGMEDGTFPQLAGQHPKVIIKQLADIRALNRDNPTMYPFALPESIGGPQSIADVAAYINQRLLMNPNNGTGPYVPGTPAYEEGKQLYKDNCVECHGENGEGKNDKFYPRIQAQHYKYLLRQFEWIRDGKRRNANPKMVEQIENFTDDDMKKVLNYVSRQDPPKDMVAPSPDWINPDFE